MHELSIWFTIHAQRVCIQHNPGSCQGSLPRIPRCFGKVVQIGYRDGARSTAKQGPQQKDLLSIRADRIIDEQYQVALKILLEQRKTREQAMKVLLQQEKITGDELKQIMAAGDPLA